jgi:hypothetical protein
MTILDEGIPAALQVRVFTTELQLHLITAPEI